MIQGKFITFTAIGIYLKDSAVASLADKWKGKSATELAESVEFFRDVVTATRSKSFGEQLLNDERETFAVDLILFTLLRGISIGNLMYSLDVVGGYESYDGSEEAIKRILPDDMNWT